MKQLKKVKEIKEKAGSLKKPIAFKEMRQIAYEERFEANLRK